MNNTEYYSYEPDCTMPNCSSVPVYTNMPYSQSNIPISSFNMTEMGFFYQPPNDVNFYHVFCKTNLVDSNYDDYYDYEFFLQNSNDFTTRYHVACKLIPHSLIINILNKEIYEMDFDVNDLKRKFPLTLHQKNNLDLNLKQYLSDKILISDFTFNSGAISQRNMYMDDSEDRVRTQRITQQNQQDYQQIQRTLQSNEFEFGMFYRSPSDNYIYHVTCKNILQDCHQIYDYEYNYDHEFFFQDSKEYYVTCKLLSHSLIINILNMKIYGRDFDINNLKCKCILTLGQKRSLELNLKEFLSFHLISEKRMISDYNENEIYYTFNENIESNTTQAVLIEGCFDNNNVHQNINEVEDYDQINNNNFSG